MQFEDRAPNIAGVAAPYPDVAFLFGCEAWVFVVVQRAVGFELETTRIKLRFAADALKVFGKLAFQEGRSCVEWRM